MARHHRQPDLSFRYVLTNVIPLTSPIRLTTEISHMTFAELNECFLRIHIQLSEFFFWHYFNSKKNVVHYKMCIKDFELS